MDGPESDELRQFRIARPSRGIDLVASLGWPGGTAEVTRIAFWSGEAVSCSGCNEMHFAFSLRRCVAEVVVDGSHCEKVADSHRHMLVFPAHCPLTVKVAALANADCLAVRVTDGFVRACLEGDRGAGLALPPGLDRADDRGWLFARLIYEECRRGGGKGTLFAESAATLLTLSLLRSHAASPAPRRVLAMGGLSPAALRLACEYMAARLGEDVALSDVAAVAGLSVGHFMVAFKRSTGRSPYAWLRARRIERARALLVQGRHAVAEVALLVGYANQSSFGAAFRRETGWTPSSWQKHHGA